MFVLSIRLALAGEREDLDAIQRRASLGNPGDVAALLSTPGAIHLPLEQLVRNCVYVAEDALRPKGFAVILPRPDGQAELDGLFVEPACWRQGIGRLLV